MDKKLKVLMIFACIMAGLAILLNLFFCAIAVDVIVQIKTSGPNIGTGLGAVFILVSWIVGALVTGLPALILIIVTLVKKLKKVGFGLLGGFLFSIVLTIVLWIVCINLQNSSAALSLLI